MKQRLAQSVYDPATGEVRDVPYDPRSDANSGVMWITLADFISHFSSVFVCRLLSDWHCFSYADRWVRYANAAAEDREWIPRRARPFGSAGGKPSGRTGYLNPQYRLAFPRRGGGAAGERGVRSGMGGGSESATTLTSIFITLTQRSALDRGEEDDAGVGLKYITLCAMRGDRGGSALSSLTSLTMIREMGHDFATSGAPRNDLTVSLELLDVDTATQITLLAATFDAEEETEFVVRVYCPLCPPVLEKWCPARVAGESGAWVPVESVEATAMERSESVASGLAESLADAAGSRRASLGGVFVPPAARSPPARARGRARRARGGGGSGPGRPACARRRCGSSARARCSGSPRPPRTARRPARRS